MQAKAKQPVAKADTSKNQPVKTDVKNPPKANTAVTTKTAPSTNTNTAKANPKATPTNQASVPQKSTTNSSLPSKQNSKATLDIKKNESSKPTVSNTKQPTRNENNNTITPQKTEKTIKTTKTDTTNKITSKDLKKVEVTDTKGTIEKEKEQENVTFSNTIQPKEGNKTTDNVGFVNNKSTVQQQVKNQNLGDDKSKPQPSKIDKIETPRTINSKPSHKTLDFQKTNENLNSNNQQKPSELENSKSIIQQPPLETPKSVEASEQKIIDSKSNKPYISPKIFNLSQLIITRTEFFPEVIAQHKQSITREKQEETFNLNKYDSDTLNDTNIIILRKNLVTKTYLHQRIITENTKAFNNTRKLVISPIQNQKGISIFSKYNLDHLFTTNTPTSKVRVYFDKDFTQQYNSGTRKEISPFTNLSKNDHLMYLKDLKNGQKSNTDFTGLLVPANTLTKQSLLSTENIFTKEYHHILEMQRLNNDINDKSIISKKLNLSKSKLMNDSSFSLKKDKGLSNKGADLYVKFFDKIRKK
jgi:hypothetical protein